MSEKKTNLQSDLASVIFTGLQKLAAVFYFNFSKSTHLKKNFMNTIRVSKSLDLDQARHFVRFDLGPNCLQK